MKRDQLALKAEERRNVWLEETKNNKKFAEVYNGTAKLSNPDHLVNHNFRKMPLKQYFT